MALKTINPTTTKSWTALENHFQEMKNNSIKDLFANDAKRAEKFHVQWNDFLVDYSKNNINKTTIDLLIKLANETGLKTAIESYFEGGIINKTENRAVLHTAQIGRAHV